MAALIKNQILKHLSKFVLNLSPSQINLSTLKGEGELTGLELNCAVLTQLLELPAWVRLVSASCNRAAIRIQWTKLKTVPIQLCLDEIRVMIETCDELLDSDKPDGSKVAGVAMPAQGYYGFTEKIVDGICVSVNLVHVNLTSLAFTASFQMSRILVESKAPSWGKASLPHTRLKDMDKGEVMVFKELSWQTVRIEARSSVSEDLTPLRLITNQARCRITLKKRMSDCAILGVRLVTILDDLLWVLTDDQLKAALHFVGSISGLVKKATETTQKEKAARKLDNSGATSRKSSQTANNPASRMFAKYDVTETSYHFYSDRIDLHFCDDPGGGRSEHPELQGGGAFQISLARLQVDYYPYHLARGDRKHWVRYASDSSHRGWLLQNLTSFDTKLLDVVLSGQNKTPLSRTGAKSGVKTDSGGASNGGCDENFRDLVVSQLSRLMTSNVILRLGDLTLWRVSTSSSAGSGKSSQPTEMLKGDCVRLHLPPDLSLLHLELTTFYYPGDLDFPLPPPCLLMSLNPVTIWFDLLTLLWLNSFTMNLQKSVASLQKSLQLEQKDAGYADVKVELVMPRIIASPRSSVKTSGSQHQLRPSTLQISASKISLSNFRSMESGSRADLANTMDKFQQYPMFFGGEPVIVHEKFWSHATGSDSVRDSPGHNISPSAMFRKDLLWTDARDVWHCAVASVWAEFEIPNSRSVTLLDATPVMLWLYLKPEPPQSPIKGKGERPNRKLLSEFYGEPEPVKDHIGVHLLAATSQLVSVQLDHDQLLFLLRLVESIGELGAFMASDSRRIAAPDSPPGMVVGGVLPQLDVSLILPGTSHAHSEENSGPVTPPGPATSERPDTPSMEDMAEKLESLQPVMDHSDPLSLPLGPCPVTSRDPAIEPPVKLQLQPAQSNGLFSNFRSSPTTANKNKLTSSFNSKMDGLSSGSYLSPGPKPGDIDIDTLSVRSDESGDSSWQDSEAGWTMVSDNMDIGEGLFRVSKDEIDRGPSPAEMAEEVYENVSEVGRGRGGSRAGVELEAEVRLVSVLTLHLARVGLAQVSGDKGSSLMIEASSLATSLAEDQDYQQFQFRFGQSGKTWSESILSAPEASVFQMRLETESVESPALALAGLAEDLDIPLSEKIARITKGSMTMEVNSANLDFLSSTLTKVSEWAQDEIIPTPIPMVINVKKTSLQLTDDNPPVPGCPQPPPVDFKVPELSLVRDARGVFTVKSISTDIKSDKSNECQDQETSTALELAMAEIRILRGKLAEKESVIKDWEAKYKELSMNNGQATIRIESLLDEKKSLMDTLKYLQEELIKSGKK